MQAFEVTANMTVVGLMAAPKIQLKSVRSMQRNTPGLLDRRIGPKDMFIVLLGVGYNTPERLPVPLHSMGCYS
ncbi:hypothetical protein EMCRGX_G025678 [Ephydatia muelleri]